ncbi:hypothetical protein MO973_05210 [Paenibacillus sp. TRM 82003]|nr:hypothetical protein [Paenibacillus sp. TRM 82003]
MSVERIVIIALWIIGPVAALLFVPRAQARRFAIGLLISQSIIWLKVVLVAEFDLMEFPVREFPKASDMGFTIQYMFFPVLCGIYFIHRPVKPWLKRIAWFLGAVSALAVIHELLAQYTDLIEYQRYNFATSWAVIAVCVSVTEVAYWWFFRKAGRHEN